MPDDVMAWVAQEAVKKSFYGDHDRRKRADYERCIDQVTYWLAANPGFHTRNDIARNSGLSVSEVNKGLRGFKGAKGWYRKPGHDAVWRTYSYGGEHQD